jgi:hypothetical protein
VAAYAFPLGYLASALVVPETQYERKYPHKEKGLYDRIKEAFG